VFKVWLFGASPSAVSTVQKSILYSSLSGLLVAHLIARRESLKPVPMRVLA
jgi:hypothetical protein